jgi:hypothetical protein
MPRHEVEKEAETLCSGRVQIYRKPTARGASVPLKKCESRRNSPQIGDFLATLATLDTDFVFK